MPLISKKIFIQIIFNFSLFLILVVGIQNSSKKSKVHFIGNETVKLPISFIIGTSFVSGSILGSFLSLNYKNKK